MPCNVRNRTIINYQVFTPSEEIGSVGPKLGYWSQLASWDTGWFSVWVPVLVRQSWICFHPSPLNKNLLITYCCFQLHPLSASLRSPTSV